MKHIFKLLILIPFVCLAQQQSDTVSIMEFTNPLFEYNMGPVVMIDSTHNNFHTKNGRFLPFSKLLSNDGFKTQNMKSLEELNQTQVLVISNAIHKNNIGNWNRPIYDAFSSSEIASIKKWVLNGGSLLLIADHMPFSGASQTLASAFGFKFCDGFALFNGKQNSFGIFSKASQTLSNNDITNGNIGEAIENLTSFTGSAFKIPEKAIGILKFTTEDQCLMPEIAWQFNEDTKVKQLEGYYQGAMLVYGQGKIAVFGEAAMFTAQTVTNENGTFKFGFHSENAPNNIQFIRNLMSWLSKP